MVLLLSGLAWLAGVVAAACFAVVLVKIFAEAGPLRAIAALLVYPYALYWAVRNARRLHIGPLVAVWIGATIASALLSAASRLW